jgi:hypothetical protein
MSSCSGLMMSSERYFVGIIGSQLVEKSSQFFDKTVTSSSLICLYGYVPGKGTVKEIDTAWC